MVLPFSLPRKLVNQAIYFDSLVIPVLEMLYWVFGAIRKDAIPEVGNRNKNG